MADDLYFLGPSKWYVTSYPLRPYDPHDNRPEGKFRDGVLDVVKRFRELADLSGVDYVEFSDDYTDANIKWYPAERMLRWDYENWGNGWATEGYRVAGEVSEDG